MSDPRVRREIALRAAQLMYTRECSEYFTAKRKAARLVVRGDSPRDLPSNAEIREQILLLADMLEGESRGRELTRMRLLALWFLRLLGGFKARLIGSVLTGHVRSGSDVDLHVFSNSAAAVAQIVEDAGYPCEVERKRVLKHGEERVFTHIHVSAECDVELTVYSADKVNYPFKSSITGKLIERADAAELERILRESVPGIDIEAELERAEDHADVWELYEMLLKPLEGVKQNPKYHPEGDALYHSLQVFDLARNVRGYDQEFMLAALLHDVGKAIDPRDHVVAGIEALEGSVSERTLFLIAHHMDAQGIRSGELGQRAKRRLSQSEDYEDLMLLAEIDKAGRVPGVVVPTVGEAIDALREMEE